MSRSVRLFKEAISTEVEKELKEDAEDIDLVHVELEGLVSLFEKYDIEMFNGNKLSTRQIISALIEKTSEPKLLIDVGQIIRRFKLWRRHLPRIEIFYAVKCNPDPVILETLIQLGAGFDVASKGEISLICSLNVPRDKILFANPVKHDNHISKAQEEDINMMTLDGKDELLKIAKLHPNCKLILRIAVNDENSTHRFGFKFGCRPNDIQGVLSLGQNLGLNLAGVSFHVGSGCNDPKQYSAAIKDARQVFTQAQEYGFNMNILDIGGGFMGEDTEESNLFFTETAKEINNAIDTYFSDIPDLKIISEPGRFFATSCGTLITHIIGRRCLENNGEKVFNYFVNSDVYGLFNNTIFDKAKVQMIPLKEHTNQVEYNSVIFGQTCDGADCLVNEIKLPEMFDGNWFYVPNHGAYTLASGATFNGFTLPEVQYLFTF